MPDDLPVKPDQPWTDIISSLKMGVSDEQRAGRSRVAGLLLRECMVVCESFPQARDSLMVEYQEQYDICLQKEVSIHQEDGSCIYGLVVGFESSGEIRIQTGGKEQLFNSADISLRKASNADN